MNTRMLPFLLLLLASPAMAQDFSVLSELHAQDERAIEPRRAAGPPRVLIVGDSWAQFMWDDGVHDAALDRFGLGDVSSLSLSLGSDPGPGYTGPEVAISGSEARQWADTASYPWIANTVALLQANPSIDHVVLSIGGNDVLAGRSGNGWYKDMDLDVPGSEQAFFDQLEQDTFAVIDAILAVRPDVRVVLSSYDYPNFDVGFWCFLFACPKREDLSRDPTNDLITDAELNALMIDVETRRRAWAEATDRVVLDNAIGLMHHVYGDGTSAPRLLPRPGTIAPLYEPFPGGNPLEPTLRINFRRASGLDADPIHLTPEGYAHKASQQLWAHVLRGVVGAPDLRLLSAGGAADGWTDGITASNDRLVVGDGSGGRIASVVRFDTGALPPGVTVTAARLWLTRVDGVGINPFISDALGAPRIDVSRVGLGTAGVVETGDLDAIAEFEDAGIFVGRVTTPGDALRIDLDPQALDGLDASGVEFRIAFELADSFADQVVFDDGDATDWTPVGTGSFAETLGSSAPVLELELETATTAPSAAVGDLTLLPPRPNPFNPMTEIAFELGRSQRVRLTVHDARGRRVRTLVDRVYAAGSHRVRFDGRDAAGVALASGVYFVRGIADREVVTRRLVLVR